MAYNPFDDIIDQDPAYMAEDSGTRAGLVQPVTTDQGPRYISSGIAKAYSLLTPEEETLQEIERNKQLRELSSAQALQGTKYEDYAGQADLPSFVVQSPGIKERLDQAGYQPQSFKEGMSRIGQFFYGDQRKAFDKLSQGQELTQDDRNAIAFAPLDTLDFLFPPLALKKLASLGFKNVTDVLKASDDIAEVKQVKDYFGGAGFIPEGVMREPDIGGKTTGVPIRPTGKGGQSREYIDYRNSQTNKLVDIIKQKNPDDQGLSINELIAKYDIQEQFDKSEPGRLKLKGPVRKILSEQLGQQYEDLWKLALEKGRMKRPQGGTENLIKAIKGLDEESFESKTAMAISLAEQAGIDHTNIIKRYNTNPEIKKLMDPFINPSDPSGRSKDVFSRLWKGITDEKANTFFDTPLDKINPTSMSQIQDLTNRMGVQDYKSPRKLLKDFLFDRYRSLKESGQFKNLTEEEFLKRQYSPDQVQEMLKEFDNYLDVERDRLYLQIAGRKVLEDLASIPKYKPYLLNEDGKLNELIVRGNKTHDQPMFVSRVTGKGRLKKEGRFINTGTEPEFLNAHFQPYNRLQVDLDPTTSKIADVMTEKGLRQKAEKMKPQLATDKNKKGDYIAPKDRLNFIGEGILQIIKDRGFEINPANYKNQFEFIQAVEKAIQQIYKERLIRTVVPTKQGAKNTNYIFGVEEPKEFTMDEKIENHVKIIIETLDNAIKNKISPEELKTGKGYMKLNRGGAVRMAMGGDPLQNLNQQQYSPDPAFDEDYFQQAVESGNLQAANLFNLFKVFKKPKVMATPSNVKQVQQANEALPQAVPGSQEIAPMQAGKPDFFFKSYLLDQLNSPNAPKASNPQGWREFLIKGRNVPEAEMTDTGILQYLEDTEKFYPDKKITREEIENLYDMSPLGNLEIRVKEATRRDPTETFVPGSTGRDLLDFDADQGRAKHKGAGSAEIDNAADEYFEVVVNVPNLPGQEKAFVQSGHFSEPNVLGFTRVGTYKNNAGDKVAVIQEMQTDMLTEVRKEQERLFAMVNNLKRQRAQKVENINRADPSYRQYEENELRLFDQKYPPELLDSLETDNLIQPFPNIVAKDLIPERTRSLNQIQEDINSLMMGNVEQYADPAYKTKVFDLAQEQQKIVEDLLTMNRSSNYQEKLKGFKVPVTGERSELENIAYTQNYTPSSYQMKEVQSFPPIPFNKQADYVDLLIKSTIKAAKQKGIDKVAIMPADIGANPRWRKTSDEARKKFQNLYDKVGVQQLKNIAKKYGGKLEVEKIVDPNKTDKGLTFLNKSPDGEFQILKQTEVKKEISDADKDAYYNEEITRIASGVTEPGDVVYTREIAPGQMMDYYIVEGRGDATDVGYRMIPLKEGESADDAMIKIVEYNPSEVDMYTISFDPSKLEEPMYLFKKKSGGSIDKDSLVSITDIYGEYGR